MNNNLIPNYKTLTRIPLFRRAVLQSFPFIEEDFDALNDYELLCKVVEYLNNVIKQQNLVGENTDELLRVYLALKNYVDSYLNDETLQPLINNKLDEMAESGQLEQIIEQFLQSTAIWSFNTVSEMQEATNLINGSTVETLGYYSINDGGGALYKITNTLSATDIQEELNDNLYATLIVKNKLLNIKQLGAKGDGISDDTDIITKAINYFHVGTDEDNQNYATALLRNYPDAGGTIYFPKGVYCISSTIKIPCYVDVDFGYSTIKAISGGTFTSDYMFSVNSYSLNSWTYGYVGRKGFIKNATIDGNNINNIKGFYIFDPHKIENIIFSKMYNSLRFGPTSTIYIDGVNVNRCDFINAQGTEYQILKQCQGENTKFTNLTFEVKDCNAIKITNGHCGLLQNIINGNICIINTEDYTISNWHCEYGHIEASPTSNLIIRDSNIYVRDNTTPIILKDGDLNNNMRSVFLEDVKIVYYLSLDEFNYDTKDIDLTHYKGNIFIKGCYREQWTIGLYSIAQSGIQYYDGTNYILVPYDECKIYNRKLEHKNSTCRRDDYIFNGIASNSYAKWNIETRTYYYKIINFADIEKLCGKITDERNINVTDSNVGVRLTINENLGQGNVLRIYRGTSSGTYTHYVDIPNPKNMNLSDNGYSVNGYKWIATNDSVPSLNSANYLERIDTFTTTLVKCKGYSVPSYGTWNQGDIIERINPSANGNLGWVCTSQGNPGTWKDFGNIGS